MAAFWFSSDFFDDLTANKPKPRNAEDSVSDFSFPAEFPYDFQTDSEENVEKRWLMSTSPQSTLVHGGGGSWSIGGSSIGSPNGVYSPPFGGNRDGVGDLIHRAAGRVEKLKMNGSDFPKGFVTVSSPRNPNRSAFQNISHVVKPQMYQKTVAQNSWPVHRNPSRGIGSGSSTAVVIGGSGGGTAVRRQRAGTGVFLPRSYASDPRKGAGSAFVPQRNGHTLNKSIVDNGGFVSDYDVLIARRNALLLQIRERLVHDRSSSRGFALPQEWTY